MMQIILGLQSTHCERLKKTWAKVRSQELNTLKELSELANPVKNFSAMRREIYSIIDAIGRTDVNVNEWFERELEYMSREVSTDLSTNMTDKRNSVDSTFSADSYSSDKAYGSGGAVPFLGKRHFVVFIIRGV
jgi:hypothetical protein